MFNLFRPKKVVSEMVLAQPDEFTALHQVAQTTAEILEIDAQNLESGFCASEVQQPHFVGPQFVVTHATSRAVDRPVSILITLEQPITWNQDHEVDYIAVVVMPETANDTDFEGVYTSVTTNVTPVLDQLTTLKSDPKALHKLNQTFTN